VVVKHRLKANISVLLCELGGSVVKKIRVIREICG
jgi:hypothetical protein